MVARELVNAASELVNAVGAVSIESAGAWVCLKEVTD
jgi:hypothetical protein